MTDPISDAINAAAEVETDTEAVGDIFAKIGTDKGAAYAFEAIATYARIKDRDLSEYMKIRERLQGLKISVTEIDKAVNAELRRNGKAVDDMPPLLDPDPDPWHDPVDGQELFDDIVGVLKKYVVLPPSAAEAIALWMGFAHTFDVWGISPRLGITSPQKRCGKTTALGVLEELAPRALTVSNITSSAVFRTISECTPTLLIDELDTYIKDNDELRGILNSGHSRKGAYTVRLVGEDHRPAKFSTWCPLITAMIGSLPDTLTDRAILIKLQRKTRAEKLTRFRHDRLEPFVVLHRKLARWGSDHIEELKRWDGDAPESLHDRAADNWRPLLAIAAAIGGTWPERAGTAALTLTDAEDDAAIGTLLLQDIKVTFDEEGSDEIATARLLERLKVIEEHPWGDWARGKGLSARGLSTLLKPYGVQSRTIHPKNSKHGKGFVLNQFLPLFARYLNILSVQACETPEHSQKPEAPIRANEEFRTDRIFENRQGSGVSHACTDRGGESVEIGEGAWDTKL